MDADSLIFKDLNDLKKKNEDLTNENKLLHLVLDKLNEGVIVTLEQGNFIHCNPAAKKILNSFKGKNDKNQKDSSINFQSKFQFLKSNILGKQEIIKNKSDIEGRGQLKVNTRVLTNNFGKINGSAYLLEDNNWRGKKNSLKQKYDKMLRSQLNSVPIPGYLWKKSEKDFKLFDFNTAADNYTKGKVKNLVGSSFLKLYENHSEIQKDFLKAFNEKAKIKKEIVYKFISSDFEREMIVWYNYIQPDMMLVYTEDITERKLREKELKQLWNAVEQTADGVVITGKNGIIEYVNPGFEKTTGYLAEEVIGKNPRILKSGHHDKTFYKKIWNTILKGESFRGTIINRKKCGELYYCEQTITPMKDEAGEIINFVSVLKDITELKKQHEQECQLKLAGVLQKRLYKSKFALSGYDLVGKSFPAVETDGDFYDFINLPNGNIGIVLADVCGHGLSSAFIMAETRAYLRAFAKTTVDPGELLTKLNCELTSDLDLEHFVTMIFISLNPTEKKFTYVNAGHLPILIVDNNNKILQFESNGIPIGIDKSFHYSTAAEVQLNKNDLFVLITDGILEVLNKDNVEFEIDRTIEILRENKNASSLEIINKIYKATREFCDNKIQEDDITAVICKVEK